MKKWWVVAVVLTLLSSFAFGTKGAKAGVNDFYFEDFMGDYYLIRESDGTSRLHVKEVLTAVFPESAQNHGIERMIPIFNQGGANRTVEDRAALNLKVLRNGVPEPIDSVTIEGDHYNIRIGDASEYVRGMQIYTLEYDFTNVVTEFDESGKNVSGADTVEAYQELYWNTNGTGWSQKFNNLTARVHFEGEVMADFTGKSWCYVGSYGDNDQGRCVVIELSDGVAFMASGLAAHENLTFDVELKAGSFVVPEPVFNYVLVWAMVLIGIALALLLIIPIRSYKKASGKRKFYKEMFVKPEYQPNPNYSVAEMAEVYIGKKKEAKVAVLLDMIVNKKLALMKDGERKRKGWKVSVLSLDGVSDEGMTLLKIMNGGTAPAVGDVVEIKSRRATTSLIVLGKQYYSDLTTKMKADGLVEKNYTAGSGTSGAATVFAVVILVLSFGVPLAAGAIEIVETLGMLHGYPVGRELFMPVCLAEAAAAVTVWTILYSKTHKYKIRTEAGLTAARYMDGVKLYIEMAETDRLKMLQSVKGADTSNEGIVKLYEKLLPYAAVLGLEDSWMHELEKYYKLDDVTEPDWYQSGVRVQDMFFAATLASSYASSSVMSSSSGSGGGGGGFSGGGGGGGGGGGW